MAVGEDLEKESAVDNLEWITLKKEIRPTAKYEQSDRDKLMDKMKTNPLVPIGCGITAVILMMGLRNFHSGNKEKAQRMMRYRVMSQGLTVGALLLTVLYNFKFNKPEVEENKKP